MHLEPELSVTMWRDKAAPPPSGCGGRKSEPDIGIGRTSKSHGGNVSQADIPSLQERVNSAAACRRVGQEWGEQGQGWLTQFWKANTPPLPTVTQPSSLATHKWDGRKENAGEEGPGRVGPVLKLTILTENKSFKVRKVEMSFHQHVQILL